MTANFIDSFFLRLNSEMLNYCILRNYENLPHDPGNDIDILVKPDDYARCAEALTRACNENSWILVKTVKRQGYFGWYFASGDLLETIQVDFYTGIFFKGIPVADIDYILSTRRKFKSFFVASPGCEASVSLPKELLMSGKVKDKASTREKIQKGINEGRKDFIYTLKDSFGDNWSEFMAERGLLGDWDGIESSSGQIKMDMIFNSLKRHHVRLVVNWIIFLFDHLNLLISGRAGLFVVLIGPDGSGKTTVADIIKKKLNPGIYKNYKSIHKDFEIIPQLKILKKYLQKFKAHECPDQTSSDHSHAGMHKPHSSLKASIYAIYYFFDFILGHFVIKRHKWRESLIVADRYFYDYYYQRAYMKAPWGLLDFLSVFIPKPDLLFYLKAEPEAIYLRKNELTCEELSQQFKRIDAFSEKRKNIIVLKTDKDQNKTARDIYSGIFKHLSSKLVSNCDNK